MLGSHGLWRGKCKARYGWVRPGTAGCGPAGYGTPSWKREGVIFLPASYDVASIAPMSVHAYDVGSEMVGVIS